MRRHLPCLYLCSDCGLRWPARAHNWLEALGLGLGLGLEPRITKVGMPMSCVLLLFIACSFPATLGRICTSMLASASAQTRARTLRRRACACRLPAAASSSTSSTVSVHAAPAPARTLLQEWHHLHKRVTPRELVHADYAGVLARIYEPIGLRARNWSESRPRNLGSPRHGQVAGPLARRRRPF